MLLCLSLQATGSLVHSLTCLLVNHVTLSFIYPVYKQLVNLSTR